MNKEKIVFLISLGLGALGVVVTVTGWREVKPFRPPSTRSAVVQLALPEFPLDFADEDDAVAFPADKRSVFEPVLETVDLPPADLPALPLPDPERVSPPPYPEPGYSDLSSIAEPAGIPEKKTEEDEEDEGEDEGGRRW
jgi:hypothetical protein